MMTKIKQKWAKDKNSQVKKKKIQRLIIGKLAQNH